MRWDNDIRLEKSLKKGMAIVLAAALAVSAGTWGLRGMESEAAQGEDAVVAEDNLEASLDQAYQAVDGNQVSSSRLQDQTIQYDEIGSLIHANHVTVQNISDSTENTRQQYTKDLDYLKSEKASAKWNKDEAKDQGDMESYAEYASYDAVYSSSIKSYNKMLDKLDEYSANKSRLLIEKQLTNAAQNLMISYQSVTLQREYLENMEKLLEAQYETTQASRQAGLATDQEVISARSSWESAAASLKSAEASENSLYRNLCVMLGVETDGSVVIDKISMDGSGTLEAMNLEEDTGKAIHNNSDVIHARHDSSSKGTSGVNKKSRTLEELEQNMTVKMQQLYEEVNQAKLSCEAASAGFKSAEITWNNTQNKQSMGMLNNAEYLQGQMQYLQKKADFESAGLTLLQAEQAYWWAVDGIADI